MDWLFIQFAIVTALIFAMIGTFMMRIRHNALQTKAGTKKPFPLISFFIYFLFGMFLFVILINYLIRNDF